MKIEHYISMSDFKKNPAKALRDAHSQRVAVLDGNKAAFYLVDLISFEALIDAAEDAQLMPLLRERTANGEKGGYTIVDVDSV